MSSTMYGYGVKFALAAIFLFFCSPGLLAEGQVYDTDPEFGLDRIIRYLGEKPQVLHRCVDILAPLVPGLAETFRPVPHTEDISPLCDGCLNAIGLVKTLIRLGVKFETVRDEVVAICKLVVQVNNYDGDTLCPGVIDNFGPLVYDAIKRTKKTNKEVCLHMNWCDPYELPSYLKAPATASQNTSPKIKVRDILKKLPDIFKQPGKTLEHLRGSSVSLDNILKQAHLLEKKLEEAMKKITSADSSDKANIAPIIAAMIKRRTKRHEDRLQNAVKVAHLTDIHVDAHYQTGASTSCRLPVCCRLDTPGEGSAGRWGAYSCNVPHRTIELFCEFVAGINPDFVIFSGDNPPHTVWLETLEGQLNASRWVAATMTRYFTNTTVYPNMGNHENFPVNMYHPPRPETQTLNKEWTKAWEKVARFGPEQTATLHKSGYYTTLVKPGLRILAYNSNYGGTGNFYNILNYELTEYKEMIAWMKTTLQQAQTNQEKVIITSHHQYGASENVIEFDETVTAILANYSDIIVWHPVGHVHRDQFRLNFDPDTGKPVGLVLMAQTMNTLPSINPGFRIFYLDPKTHQVLDYDQYSIDIAKINEGGDLPSPKKLYRATEEYQVADISPAAFLDLKERMEVNSTLLQRYWYNRRSRSGVDGVCDSACAVSETCHMISSTYALYRQCMRDHQRARLYKIADDITTTVVPITTDYSSPLTEAEPTSNAAGPALLPELSTKILTLMVISFVSQSLYGGWSQD